MQELIVQPGETVVFRDNAFRNYYTLTKPRITLLILVSTAVGYCFGIQSRLNAVSLINALLGTALMAAGSATLNQWYERDIDSKMNRTRMRPMAAGLMEARHGLYFGIVLSLVGLMDLAVFTNRLAALLGFLTWFSYLFVYTPLKRLGPICTTIGALPGAMPPLIGFAAASGHLTAQAWLLFGILFLWQFPHFHAIAWMYRDDYARGDIKMLAVVRPDGAALSGQVLLTLLVLLPVTIAPAFASMAGTVYLIAALVLGLVFLGFGIQFSRERTYPSARRLLLASVIYLPLLFAFLVLDNPKFPMWHR